MAHARPPPPRHARAVASRRRLAAAAGAALVVAAAGVWWALAAGRAAEPRAAAPPPPPATAGSPPPPAVPPRAALPPRPAAPRRQEPAAFDASAWSDVPPAFGARELGRVGPYVRTALDAAREDMAFCFKAAPRADGPADPPVLMLHLQARDGALDLVGTTVDHRGDRDVAVLECCREVLRGLEIAAFNPVPGQRYRLKYTLE